MNRDPRLPDGPLCDFCGLPPAYRFPTRNFTFLILGSIQKDIEGWDACPTCAELVESHSWDLLVQRGITFYLKRMGRPERWELYIVISQLYQLFDANRIGPKEPLDVGGS